MRLIYITAKKYPAATADHIFIKAMAEAFARLLRKDFLFAATDIAPGEFKDVPHISPGLNLKRGLSLYYFLWLPVFVIKRRLNASDTVFFSNDPNLLSILMFWKKLLGWRYRLLSEWHMLFGDWRDGFISRNSTGLVTTTNHLKDIISSKFSIKSGKLLTVYGGVDLDIFNKNKESVSALRNRLGLSVDRFIVGYVGFYKTMGMAKGLDTMIAALALIPDKNVMMAFVGGRTEEIIEYQKLAEENGVYDRVIFVPVVITSDVPAYEKAMDALVIPYPNEPHFRDYGFPMKVYEYMASKRPILYSRLPIIEEVLANYGISFEPGNSRDLARKITELKKNPAAGEALAHRSYGKVTDYTWKKRAENIIAFLRQP